MSKPTTFSTDSVHFIERIAEQIDNVCRQQKRDLWRYAAEIAHGLTPDGPVVVTAADVQQAAKDMKIAQTSGS